jgi:tetratricopeptide (TPR) repeat protein
MAKIRHGPNGAGAKKKPKVRSDQELRQHPDGTAAVKNTPETPKELYSKASDLFYKLQVEQSLPVARKALNRFEEACPNDLQAPYPTLLLLGQIYLALGEIDLSREHYLKATEIDPEGRETGAEPFLWSAQLSEEGGEDSIRWLQKACGILRRELKGLEATHGIEEAEDEIVKTRRQLGEALCSMTEVYMTDLSYVMPAGYASFHTDGCIT